WAQHYAFGLDGYALTQRLNAEPASFTKQSADNAVVGRPYAYLAEWQSRADVRLLGAVLKDGINVRFSQKKFRLADNEYPAGTLIITRAGNDTKGEEFDRHLREIGDKYNQQLTPVGTGLVQSGADFGSSSVHYLKRPRVALLSGEGTASNQVGEVWHFFDQQIDYPLTMLATRYFENVDLHVYDVLILPDGNYNSILDQKQLKRIKEWISAGGRLIALGGANRFLAAKEGFQLTRKDVEADSVALSPARSFDERQRRQISSLNTGSIYKITMDSTHPLAFGYDSLYFSLKLNAD